MNERHNFTEYLARNRRNASLPFWGVVYRKMFPDFHHRHIVGDEQLELQRKGIDSVIETKSGARFNVDEKLREIQDKRGRLITPETHGILLEEWSSMHDKRAGWWRDDKHTHFIAYAFLATEECFFLPFPALRRIRVEYGSQWLSLAKAKKEGFFELPPVKNEGPNGIWETFSIAVPVRRLQAAITDMQRVSWKEEPKPQLVVPTLEEGRQLDMGFDLPHRHRRGWH